MTQIDNNRTNYLQVAAVSFFSPRQLRKTANRPKELMKRKKNFLVAIDLES